MNRLAAVILSLACCAPLCCSTGTTKAASGVTTKTDPALITQAEISGQNFRSVYEAVQRLRPDWLRKRDTSPTRMGMTVSGGTGVQVDAGVGLVAFLDNTRLGSVEAFRDVTPGGIESIEYMDAAKASARLPGIGSSSITGAIVAHSRSY